MKPPSVEQEQRALRRLAGETWLRAARKCGNPYTDRQALSLVRQQAMSALVDEDGATILRAITARMDHDSTPRRIPEWARIQGSDERADFHNDLKRQERAKRDVIVDHNGTLYLGHVPHAVGDRCSECGGTLAEHRLAQKPQLRRIDGTVGALVEGLRS